MLMIKTVIKLFGILSIILLLGGCGSTKTVTQTKFEMPEISNPSPPPQLQLRDVEWRVYNKEDLKNLIKKADERGQNIALFALSSEEYEDLSTNMQDIKGYISKQKEIIIFYRRTLKDIEQSVKQSNDQANDEENSEGGFFDFLF